MITDFWETLKSKADKITVAAGLVGLVCALFFFSNPGNGPTDRGDGRTSYSLIDQTTDARWVLTFDTEKTVERPEAKDGSWLARSFQGSGPVPNQKLSVHLSAAEIGIGSGQDPIVEVRIGVDSLLTKMGSFESSQREKCSRAEEIAPQVIALQDTTRALAELSYELSNQRQTFEEYYDLWHSDRCFVSPARVSARYAVTDEMGKPIGDRRCFVGKEKCRFLFWAPFERGIIYNIAAKDLKDIVAIHQGAVEYLVAATDHDATTGFAIADRSAPPSGSFDVATYVPSPSFSPVQIDPETVPTEGFRQLSFDLAAPGAVVLDTVVSRIARNTGRSNLDGIKLDRFASYWVSRRTFAEPTRKMINIDASFGHTIVRVNGVVVYDYAPRAVNGDDLQAALDNPVFKKGDMKFGFISTGPRPQNPFSIDFPAGESVIEVEFINAARSLEFSLSIGDDFKLLTRSAARTHLGSAAFAGADVYYFGVYGSARPDNRITLRLPESDAPAILILDSLRSVAWHLVSDRTIAATVVSTKGKTTGLVSGDFGSVIHLNKPLLGYKERRDCTVSDLTATIEDLAGMPLAGSATHHDIGLMTAVPYVQSDENQGRRLLDGGRRACS